MTEAVKDPVTVSDCGNGVTRFETGADYTRYIVHVVKARDMDPMNIFAGADQLFVLAEPITDAGRGYRRWMTLTTDHESLSTGYVSEKLGVTGRTDLRNLTLLIAYATGRKALVEDCPCGVDHRP